MGAQAAHSIQTALPVSALRTLRRQLRGPLILPEDPDYERTRRVYNAMIDRRPAAIARCLGPTDVIAALTCARKTDLPLTIRGGGHAAPGHAVADGALMIDLSLMKGITVDARARVATAAAGLRLGEFIVSTEAYGLVSPTGTDADTGLAGLTLGGGYGWLNGRFGLAVDNVLGAEVVTADGRVLNVDAEHHPDLYWALRGGSGNFGVVTSFVLQLHPLSQVTGGMLIYPFAQAAAMLEYYRDIAASAPDELTIYAALFTLPTGEPAAALMPCWSGDLARGETILASIRSWGSPLVDTIQPMPYSTMNTLLAQASPPGMRNYWKQHLLSDLDDGLFTSLLNFAAAKPTPRSAIVIDHVHGAARRIAPGATAFPHRNSPHGLIMLGIWEDAAEDAANIAWVRDLAAATRPFSTGGSYVNESWDEQPGSAFGSNYDRLAAIKQRYDPGNLFRHTVNIVPSAH